jgi:hypothetical protein
MRPRAVRVLLAASLTLAAGCAAVEPRDPRISTHLTGINLFPKADITVNGHDCADPVPIAPPEAVAFDGVRVLRQSDGSKYAIFPDGKIVRIGASGRIGNSSDFVSDDARQTPTASAAAQIAETPEKSTDTSVHVRSSRRGDGSIVIDRTTLPDKK